MSTQLNVSSILEGQVNASSLYLLISYGVIHVVLLIEQIVIKKLKLINFTRSAWHNLHTHNYEGKYQMHFVEF